MSDLGEKEKARALVAEYLGAGRSLRRQRPLFGCRLARIDPAAALGIARDLATTDRQGANRILWNVAIGLAEDNPAEAERVLRLVPQEEGQSWMQPALAWKLARVTRRVPAGWLTSPSAIDDSPQTYLYLACGLKGRDPAAAEAAFWKGIKEIDRLLEEKPQYLAMKIEGGPGGALAPGGADRPDPCSRGLLARLAARPPLDPPRSLGDGSLSELAELLAWYDREAAAAAFETDRLLREQTADPVLASRLPRFESWVLWDPRAAVAEIEQLHATNDQDAKAILQTQRVRRRRDCAVPTRINGG